MLEAGRQPTIRIRRRPVAPPTSAAAAAEAQQGSYQASPLSNEVSDGGRRRSSSDPSRGLMPGSSPLRPVKSTTGPGGLDVMPQIAESGLSGSKSNAHFHDAAGSPENQSDIQDFGSNPNDEFGDEYRQDLVDVLDTIGQLIMFPATFECITNAISRPRSLDINNSHKCTKFSLCSRSRSVLVTPTNVFTYSHCNTPNSTTYTHCSAKTDSSGR
jgi:hypothetical protein